MTQEQNKQSGLSWQSTSAASAPASAAPKPAITASPVASTPVAETKQPKRDSTAMPAKAPGSQAPVYAGLLVGGIIVGVLLATAWSSLSKPAVPTVMMATSTQSSSQMTDNSTGQDTDLSGSEVGMPLTVGDQAAGPNVTVSRLSVSVPTWVVVYVSQDGKPGNALGARLFFPGDTGGQVALLRNTEAGVNYFVGLSIDNGDKIFSLTDDKPLAGADGQPLWATFTAR